MKVLPFQEIEQELWDDFVAKSPEAWLYHSSAFVKWLLEIYKTSKVVALCNDDGTIRSMFQMNLSRDYFLSPALFPRLLQRVVNKISRTVGLASPWEIRILSTGLAGIALAQGINDRNRRKYIQEALHLLDETASRERIDELHVRNVEFGERGWETGLLTSFWQAGLFEPLTVPRRLFARVDLEQSEKEIWAGIDEDCRNEIRKAQKQDVTCVADPPDAFERFYALHAASWNRTFGYHHPREYLQGMTRHLRAFCHYFFAAHEGKDVAVVVLHCFKDAALYDSGGSLPEGQRVYANNFLLYNSMLWAKDHGHRWFGLGLFDSYPGRDVKEFSVGKYKAQFMREYLPSIEMKKSYTRKALRLGYWERLALLEAHREVRRGG
jgi:hypothetical protein